jgi:ABC-2 type transport system permease protein
LPSARCPVSWLARAGRRGSPNGWALLFSARCGWRPGRARAWAGTASQHSGVRFGSLVTAGLNVVPPGLFLLGLGALVLGAWPRRASAAVYGYLAWSFLVEFAGGVVHASHWLLDGLGVLGAVLGGILLHHRDLKDA